MPWNDDSNPSPWGAPSTSDQPRKPAKPGDSSNETKPDAEKAKDGKSSSPWAEAPRPRLPRRPAPPPRLGAAPRKPEPKGDGDGPQIPGPNIDELTRQLRERFGHLFASAKGHGLRREAVLGLVGVAVIGWGLSGLYVVQPEEQAVVTRFGQFVGETSPGLNYHLPAPIEAVEKVSTASVRSLDIGAASGSDTTQQPAATDASAPVTDATVTVAPAATDTPSGDLMLTGDENIVDLNFTVQWRVNDAAKFLFRLSDPDSVVKTVAQSAMREVVGKTPLQDIMTTGRGQLQIQAASLMQRVLDSYGAGVTIVEVQVRGANPPRDVIPAFREVINAGQDAETAANQANAYRNRVVNEAKGDAAKIIQDAQGYQQQSVLEAQGDAARFTAVDAEYKHAPAVTRERLYLEMMQRVLSASNKVIVDTPKGSTAPIVLPSDIFRHGDATAAAAPTVVQPQPAPQAASPAPAQPTAGGTAQ
ncbi:MAG: FtsH protease activity modulator HflK [Caulobacteraceae bacterium]